MRFLLTALLCLLPLAAQDRALLVISIDGMRPDYVSAADQHGLKIPNLRRIFATGAHATGVRGVLPTVTYPSHTTLMTGVWPAKHGIYANTTFDPLGKNQSGWYWYGEDIHVPTLWQAAAKAGYVVGSVSWPVTVGAPGISWLIPEYWRASTEEDLKLIRALSTPGMMKDLEPQTGKYVADLNNAMAGDWARTHYAEAIIRQKHARFMTVHLAALDHLEHASGPFSASANAALEEIDGMVGTLEKAMQDDSHNAAICIVSDHGFAAIDHQLNIRVPFVNAGLLNEKNWTASPWDSGGSAFVLLKDPSDQKVRSVVEKLLRDLAAEPANGINHILNRDEIAAMGGASNVEFAVDMKPGFSIGNALDGPVVKEIKPGGTHGYAPTHPEMLASLLIAGPGIAPGVDLGEIDMRSIAPTLATYIGASFTTGDLPAIALAAASAPAAPISQLRITGTITPLELKAEDLAGMPRETVSIPDQDGTEVRYEGVPLREILKRAGVPLGKELRGKALASYIVAKAHDGYQVVFSLGEIDATFGNESILVADKRDGKALFGYQGPFRLVCPNDKAGARSVRMLETLELVKLQK